jgi:hypothetical protein
MASVKGVFEFWYGRGKRVELMGSWGYSSCRSAYVAKWNVKGALVNGLFPFLPLFFFWDVG